MSSTDFLDKAFFQSNDVLAIAKALLGKYLITNIDGEMTAGKIVETEAYRGPDDKGSHAFNNKRTNRTEVVFGEGGHAYVYLCYGIHHLFNVVTGEKDWPHCVLIRAIEPSDNIKVMLKRRRFEALKPQLTSGPGVMSKALGIEVRHNGVDLCHPQSPIRIADRGIRISTEQIIASPRVGIDYAGECAAWDWRFRIRDSEWVSRAK
jgi:DNA-3-methyladenine glycosylase